MFLHDRLPSCSGVRELAALVLVLLPTALAAPAAAQPSPEEIAAIRQSCRSDFIRHCSGVQPGGREALQCLERNAAQLSTECASAVGAVAPSAARETKPEAPPPAVAEAPAPQPSARSQADELAAVQQACTIKDFMSHCSWIQPGNPELLLCLRANAADLSPACRNVVAAPADAIPAGTAPTVAAAPPAAAAPAASPPAIAVPPPAPVAPRTAAAPKRPTAKQASAIRTACRSDFISHCGGVQPGGRDALMCLERNQAAVSPSCQTALAAIGGGAPGPGAQNPAAPGPGAATPDAPAPPSDRLLIPRLPLRAEIMILRICAADHRNLCGDVPPGGGRILGCLAGNAARLMPECRAVLSEVAARGR